MKHFAPLCVATMLFVNPAWGVEPPEHLLPAASQVYLRWDGIAAHREQYLQSALGQLLAHDLAPLRQEILQLVPKTLQTELTQRKLLDGLPPDQLAKIHATVADASRLVDVVTEHGFIVAADVSPLPSLWQLAVGSVESAMGQKVDRNPLLPRIQVTVVIPDAADQAAPILSAVRLLGTDSTIQLKEEMIVGRKVVHAKNENVYIAAWVEGPHVVVAGGTEPPTAMLARMTGGEARLDTHPLYKRLQSDTSFQTDIRGFVDLKSLIGMGQRLASMFDATLGGKIDALGIDGLHTLIYRSGFDGAGQRETIEIDAPGPRRGLLKLVGGKPVALDQLPPLPPDASRWSAHRLDPNTIHEVATMIYDFTHPPDPEAVGEKETAAQRLDRAAGLDVKGELLPFLGDTVVAYSSPSEGLISFGQVVAVEVKDNERVLQALDQILQTQAGGTVRIRKRPIADGEVREIYVKKPGFFFTPTYTVYKGWLVASLYPQPVQAFIQRASGGAKVWEPDAIVKSRLAALPKNRTGLGVADVRPTIQQGLTFAPLIISAQQSFGGGNFEVGTLPSASVVNQRLSPSVTTMTDDGKTLRWESRGAVILPGDFFGIDPFLLALSSTLFN